jgi:hypothetical protein
MAEKSASVVGRHVKAVQASFFRHEASRRDANTAKKAGGWMGSGRALFGEGPRAIAFAFWLSESATDSEYLSKSEGFS